jgi:hypothetical protein
MMKLYGVNYEKQANKGAWHNTKNKTNRVGAW